MLVECRYLLYGAGYLVRTKLLRREIPFIGGLVLNESCNLSCRHCRVANRSVPDLTFAEAETGLRRFYEMGIRSVFIEGGEPLLWRDGSHDLESIVALARSIGFLVVSIYTNGTLPLASSADTLFVSLDGIRETNDELRGSSYNRIIANLEATTHPNIIINHTINRRNASELELFCETLRRVPQVRGFFFYFHTPYYGKDELFLDLIERRTVIARILQLKKDGYPVCNSAACLRDVAADTWTRPSRLCYVYADRKLYTCCRAYGHPEVCAECGYLGYPEIINILRLRPSAVLSAFAYLPRL